MSIKQISDMVASNPVRDLRSVEKGLSHSILHAVRHATLKFIWTHTYGMRGSAIPYFYRAMHTYGTL